MAMLVVPNSRPFPTCPRPSRKCLSANHVAVANHRGCGGDYCTTSSALIRTGDWLVDVRLVLASRKNVACASSSVACGQLLDYGLDTGYACVKSNTMLAFSLRLLTADYHSFIAVDLLHHFTASYFYHRACGFRALFTASFLSYSASHWVLAIVCLSLFPVDAGLSSPPGFMKMYKNADDGRCFLVISNTVHQHPYTISVHKNNPASFRIIIFNSISHYSLPSTIQTPFPTTINYLKSK